MQDLFELAHRTGLTTSLDTGWDPEERWAGDKLLDLLDLVDIFFPNKVEACAITGAGDAELALRELGQRTMLVVVKQGAEGAMALPMARLCAALASRPTLRTQLVQATLLTRVFSMPTSSGGSRWWMHCRSPTLVVRSQPPARAARRRSLHTDKCWRC